MELNCAIVKGDLFEAIAVPAFEEVSHEEGEILVISFEEREVGANEENQDDASAYEGNSAGAQEVPPKELADQAPDVRFITISLGPVSTPCAEPSGSSTTTIETCMADLDPETL